MIASGMSTGGNVPFVQVEPSTFGRMISVRSPEGGTSTCVMTRNAWVAFLKECLEFELREQELAR